jgi:hypothetical protein
MQIACRLKQQNILLLHDRKGQASMQAFIAHHPVPDPEQDRPIDTPHDPQEDRPPVEEPDPFPAPAHRPIKEPPKST